MRRPNTQHLTPNTFLTGCLLAAALAAGAIAAAARGIDPPDRPAPLEWGPVPIWWWSGDQLTLDRLTWQLDRMKEGGLRNAVLLNLAPSGPLYGSDADEPAFFSEEWWTILKSVLAEAKKRDLHIWLYDQFGFSGAGLQSKVIVKHPEHAGWGLGAVEADSAGGAVHLALPGNAQLVFAAAYPVADGVLDCGKATDLSAAVKDRTLDWQAPAGLWKVMLFYSTRGGFDYLSKAACAQLIDDVHGEYARRIRRYLGSVVPGTFQDELPGHQGWTGDFAERFQRRHRYDLRPFLAALFHNVGPTTAKTRCAYFDTAAALAEEAYYIPLSRWHERYGMLCGTDQSCRDGDPVNGQQTYFDYFRTQRWLNATGNDQGGSSKINSSLAHLYKHPRVWQEGYYGSGWGQSPEDLLALINGSFVEGGTLYNPHAFYYSTRGAWWEWAPPCTSFRQPYWEHYPVLAGYVSRLSYLLTRGHHVADVAVLYPSRTIQAETTLRGGPSPSAHDTNRAFWEVVRGVRAAGYDLDVVDEESLQRDGSLDIAGEHHCCLILPRVRTLGRGTAELINSKLSGGHPFTLAYQGLPTATSDAGLQENILAASTPAPPDMAALLALLKERLVPDVQPATRYLHRRDGKTDVYFLPQASPGQTVTFRATGVPELWDLYAGKVTKPISWRRVDGGTAVELRFEGGPGIVMVFTPGKAEPLLSRTNLVAVSQTTLRDGAIEVKGMAEGTQVAFAAADVKGVHYYAEAKTASPAPLKLEGDWPCRLHPTMDNRWGDFDLPASPGPLPVDCRRFRYRQEAEGEDGMALGWNKPDFDDKQWQEVTYSVGPRCLVTGQQPAASDTPPKEPWSEYWFSTRFGIEHDPLASQWLGPKGHVPPEFIDLGKAEAGAVRYVKTWLVSDAEQAVQLTLGAQSPKAAWLNGAEVARQTESLYNLIVPVTLKTGHNEFVLRLQHGADRPLRAYFFFTRRAEAVARAYWIWNAEGKDVPQCFLRRTFDLAALPNEATLWITADNGYQLFVNGAAVGSEEGVGTEVWSRAEKYDVRKLLRLGQNVIAVRAVNFGGPAGLVAVAKLDDLTLVTDASWRTSPTADKSWADLGFDDAGWKPAQVLDQLGSGIWGHVVDMPGSPALGATLPEAFWLEKEPRPADFVVVGFDAAPQRTRRVGWYRFLLPPGATEMQLTVRGKATVFVDSRELPLSGGKAAITDGEGKGPRPAAIRVEQEPGDFGGAPFRLPVTFACAAGTIPLGSWHQLGLQNYSGGLVYHRRLTLPAEFAGQGLTLDLGRVRGTAEVLLNGKSAGIRIAPPYRFDLGSQAKAGENEIEVKVFGTLGPHYKIANATPYVFPGQEMTGIFGPVRLMAQAPVELTLRPHQGVEAGSSAGLVNWALPKCGATATASSEMLPGYPAASVLTDDTSGANWEHQGGWNDATINAFPDWLQVDLGAVRSVRRIVVATHPNAAIHGILQFEIACRVGGEWKTVVTEPNNFRAVAEYDIDPVQTDAVRITVASSHDPGGQGYSRIVAVRVMGTE